jgi:two-component system sensor histidine kinase YesM
MPKQATKEKPVFQRELEALARKKILLLVVVGCLLFCLPVFGLQIVTLRLNAERHLDFLQATFDAEYTAAKSYLEEDTVQALLLGYTQGERRSNEVRYSLSRYNAQAQVQMSLLLLDADLSLRYSSFGTEELNLHRLVFSRVVAQNAVGQTLYNTVYYLDQDSPEYVLCLPLVQDGAVQGYAVAFLNNTDWNRLLSDYQYDAVITNSRGSIIYCSKSGFLTNEAPGKFQMAEGQKLLSVNGARYLVIRRSLAAENVVLYSLVYWPSNFLSMAAGILVLVAMGMISFAVFRRAAQVMAEKNARSVEQLVQEIRIIRKVDDAHVIQIHTGDEYETIAEQINKMVRSINQLNARNTELARLNGAIELQNLQAQINPHFIYNTLDNIKFLIPADPMRAVRLIEKFAGILRYSINTTCREVSLEQDAEYIRDYLYIQKTRFGERFRWDMEIEPGCEACVVPKLLVQPLIENSIQYGFANQMELQVHISFWREGNYLLARVEDNGPGVTPARLEELHTLVSAQEMDSVHHGLRNVSRRLALQYGAQSGLTLESSNAGFAVTAHLYLGEEDTPCTK